jgi:arylsulfatase A-like enzyme
MAAGLASCGAPDDGSGPASVSPNPARNVLVISLDTLRADRLGAYGYPRLTSPFLDSLAKRGTLFTRAYVNSHGTPPSHASLLTSLYQESHRVSFQRNDGLVQHWLPESLTTMAETFRASGFDTWAVTGGGYLSQEFNFDQGFEVFDDQPKDFETAIDRTLAILNDRARESKPWFGFLHTFAVHSPYEPPHHYQSLFVEQPTDFYPNNENLIQYQTKASELRPEDLEYLSSLYDSSVRYMDALLQMLFLWLERGGFLEDTVVVITSDHGEEFGEHGGLLHGVSLYQELVKVPLLILGPGFEAGKRDPGLASLIDVAPTLYQVTGVSPISELSGRSLRDESSRGPVYLQYTDLLYGVIDGDWKLIRRSAGPSLLFDLAADPLEQIDVAGAQAEHAAQLEELLDRWLGDVPRPQLEMGEDALSQDKLDELRALGYAH